MLKTFIKTLCRKQGVTQIWTLHNDFYCSEVFLACFLCTFVCFVLITDLFLVFISETPWAQCSLAFSLEGNESGQQPFPGTKHVKMINKLHVCQCVWNNVLNVQFGLKLIKDNQKFNVQSYCVETFWMDRNPVLLLQIFQTAMVYYLLIIYLFTIWFIIYPFNFISI